MTLEAAYGREINIKLSVYNWWIFLQVTMSIAMPPCTLPQPNTVPKPVMRKFILSPHIKRDHNTQVEISKQTLNQLYYFGDKSKIIKHLWQFS
jgi:hypothetical protein